MCKLLTFYVIGIFVTIFTKNVTISWRLIMSWVNCVIIYQLKVFIMFIHEIWSIQKFWMPNTIVMRRITIPFVLVLYCIVSNICYLVEKINHPFINQHKNRIMTNIIEQQFGLLVLIFGTRKKCLQFAICNSQFCGT